MRQRLSLDRNWRFALGHAADPSRDFEFPRDRSLVKAGEARGAAGVKFDDANWKTIDLPHDWAIELPLVEKDEREHVEHGSFAIGPDFPENSVGWYRRRFDIPRRDLGKRISIEFDGVFRDSIVWINGHRLGRHASGYTPFRYDLTDFLNYSGTNIIAVRVDATNYEGWWYEGAGIYRHVYLLKTSPLHVAPYGTFVTTKVRKGFAEVTVRTTICNDSDKPRWLTCVARVFNPRRHGLKTRATQKRVRLDRWAQTGIVQQFRIKEPLLWSCDEPNLYRLETKLISAGKTQDTCDTTFGIRTFRWDSRKGFFLNGKPLKIKGICNHRDHAGVGVALPDRLHVLRIEKIKEMGVNAFRASHYPHAPETLDACDRLGLLVMAENRLAGSSPEVLSQLEMLILRDRNHPSVFLWSLANEEHTVQWSIAGERIGRTMARLCHTLDPTRKVTTAMHDKGLGVGFANIVDVHGWNYIKVGDIDAYHRKHPDRPIIGSEEASTVCTRGIYADDKNRGYVGAYDIRAQSGDRRPSTGGNSFPPATGSPRVRLVRLRLPRRTDPVQVALCRLPFWRDGLVRISKGQLLLLQIVVGHGTRAAPSRALELGRTRRRIDRCPRLFQLRRSRIAFESSQPRTQVRGMQLPCRLGCAVRTRNAHCDRISRGKTDRPGKARNDRSAAQIVLHTDRPILAADGEDVAVVSVSVHDAQGRPVPTADNRIIFEISGEGKLLGVGNGDPSSHEPDKASHRRLFNGLCMALVQSSRNAGEIKIVARSTGLVTGSILFKSRRAAGRR